MKKEKFITVMAVLDDDTQDRLLAVQKDLEHRYGKDTKTGNIPFHITLGSYAVEETDEIVDKIKCAADATKQFAVRLGGLNHFGHQVRFVEPEINEELRRLHAKFDSDYANGYDMWIPHVTVYRHEEPTEIEPSEEILGKLKQLTQTTIVGIELGEFFPPKKIIRILFRQ